MKFLVVKIKSDNRAVVAICGCFHFLITHMQITIYAGQAIMLTRYSLLYFFCSYYITCVYVSTHAPDLKRKWNYQLMKVEMKRE